MQGINIKRGQEWPDPPEGASPEFKKLVEQERTGVHKQIEETMHHPNGTPSL